MVRQASSYALYSCGGTKAPPHWRKAIKNCGKVGLLKGKIESIKDHSRETSDDIEGGSTGGDTSVLL